MSRNKMLVVTLVMAISFGSTGSAIAGMGGGGSHSAGGGFPAGHSVMNRTMTTRGADNMVSQNQNQLHHQERISNENTGAIGQHHLAPTTGSNNIQGNVVLDQNTLPPASSNP